MSAMLPVSAKRVLSACFREVSGDLMHIKIIAFAASLTLVAATSSRAEDNRACISKATETLPHISGLVVKKTRTRPVPAAILATCQGHTHPPTVDMHTAPTRTPPTYSHMP